jgi:DNA primase large subunit
MDGNEAAKLEQEMIRQEEMQQTPPEEVAATMFNLYLPRFQNMVDKLSNKSLKRVLKALIEYPLVEDDMKLSETEKDAFLVAENLILAKVMMINHTLMQQQVDLQNQQESDNLKSESENETNG